ncbi:MAG: four helix bundle protein [Cyclobacteriaceae bacterium]
MKNYKDLIVWKKAHELVLLIYRETAGFPKIEQYNLTSQIRRVATSIPTNLAEGCGKLTQSDFARYLQISLGSTQEVEYLAFLSHALGYLREDQYKRMDKQINEVKAMLICLVTKVRKDSSST